MAESDSMQRVVGPRLGQAWRRAGGPSPLGSDRMSDHHLSSDDRPEPDEAMPFYVFMVVFWPVSIVLGLIDFYLIKDHDLRLYNLLAGAIAGWIAVEVYRARQLREEDQAA